MTRHLAGQGLHRPEGRRRRADLVPGRGLRARAARVRRSSAGATALTPQEPGTVKLAAAISTAPPAAGLAIEGEIAVKPSTKDAAGLCRLHLRARRRADRARCASRSKACRHRRRRQGRPRRRRCRRCAKTNRPLEADVIVQLSDPAAAPSSAPSRCPSTCKTARIGIKPLFDGDEVREGEHARASRSSCSAPTARPSTAKGLKWELLRLDQR